jgi:phage-related protein
MGAVNAVFGDSAKQVEQWAADSAKAVGMSTAEYATMAAKVGASFKNMGLSQADSAESTQELIKLGADLAATFGGTTTDAVNALGAALRGEADPAERYGLALNKTAVNAELAATGQDKLTGASRKQAEAQAILKLATEQAGGAVGAFAREQDTAAGSTQTAKAEFINAAAVLGQTLLPVVVTVMGAFTQFAVFLQQNAEQVRALIGVVLKLAAAILAVHAALTIVKTVKAFASMVSGAGLVVVAIEAVIAIVLLLWRNCEGFRDACIAIWNVIRSAAEVAWRAIQSVVTSVVRVLTSLWETFGPAVIAVFERVKAAAVRIWNAIVPVVQLVVSTIQRLWDAFYPPFSALMDRILAVADRVWNAIIVPVQSVIAKITAAWEALVSTVTGIWNRIASAITTALAPVTNAIEAIASLWDRTVGAISRGIDNIKGWLDGISSKISSVGDKMQSIIPGGRAAPAPAVFYQGSPALYRRGAGAAGPTMVQSGAGAPVYNITVNGAVDADGVARTISKLLSARSRRVGPVLLGGVTQ